MNFLARAFTNGMTIMATDPSRKVTSWLDKWKDWSTNIGWAVAIVCIIIVGIIFMLPSEEQHRNAKKFAIFVLIGATLLSVGPAVINAIKSNT